MLHAACLAAQSCPTLCDPMDCSLVWSPPGSSIHGIFQARILEWGAISFSRGFFPTQGSNLHLLPCFLHCRQVFYPLSHWRSPKLGLRYILLKLHSNHSTCLAFRATNVFSERKFFFLLTFFKIARA